MAHFSDLQLNADILATLARLEYKEPTPIQEQSIPHILAGKDFLGIAQTGTGKTAAFSLPILQKLQEEPGKWNNVLPKALILVPTRELAIQTLANLKQYGKHTALKFLAIFGGVNENPQLRELKKGVDILIATPGRLMDFYFRKQISLKGVRFCVLDEVDRMLDMGFEPNVRKIMGALPKSYQTLLFSATLPKEIEKLVGEFLKDPVTVKVTPPAQTAGTIQQSLFFIPKGQKQEMLEHVLKDSACDRAIVFSRTKFGADRIGRHLRKACIDNCVLHGDKSQKERQKALDHFREGDVRVLVATDVAARGLDVSHITHVINFDLPEEPESYVHRIGRTGRSGCAGEAYSFCDVSEKPLLRAIEKKIQERIPVVSARKFWPDFEPKETHQNSKTGKVTQRSKAGKSKKKSFRFQKRRH